MPALLLFCLGCAQDHWAQGTWVDDQSRSLQIVEGNCNSDGASFPCSVTYTTSTQAFLYTTRGSRNVRYTLKRVDGGMTMASSSGQVENLTRMTP